MVNSESSLKWVMEHVKELRSHHIGTVWLWGSDWVYLNGSVPGPEGYAYSDVQEIKLLKAECRLRGLPVGGYWSLARWLAAGLDYDLAARNIHETDLDLVLVDDGPMPSEGQTHQCEAIWELWDFFRYLKGEGYLLAHHCSVEPFLGRINWRPPWAGLFDYHLWGETCKFPTGDQWWTLRRMPGYVNYMLPKNDPLKLAELKTDPLQWIDPIIRVLGERAVYRGYFQDATDWETYKFLFLPRWQAKR